MKKMTLGKFIEVYKVDLSLPTLKKWVSANIDVLKRNKIVGVMQSDIRKRYVVFQPERLIEAYFFGFDGNKDEKKKEEE